MPTYCLITSYSDFQTDSATNKKKYKNAPDACTTHSTPSHSHTLTEGPPASCMTPIDTHTSEFHKVVKGRDHCLSRSSRYGDIWCLPRQTATFVHHINTKKLRNYQSKLNISRFLFASRWTMKHFFISKITHRKPCSHDRSKQR